MSDSLDAALGGLIVMCPAPLAAQAEQVRAEILGDENLSDESLERCLRRVVDIALESAREPAARAASFAVVRATRALMDERAPTGMLKTRHRITAVFEVGDAWEETRSEALGVLSLFESLGQPPGRMQITMLCHALWKLSLWEELEAWSNRLLHEAKLVDDWRSELLALEQLAEAFEATGRSAAALQAREQMVARLRALGKTLKGPMSKHILSETDRLRAIVTAAFPEGPLPDE
jgi:hypothetical protein